MKTGIKIIVGIIAGAALAYFYFNRGKKTTAPAAIGPAGGDIKQPPGGTGVSQGAGAVQPEPVKNRTVTEKTKTSGVIINGFIDGVNPNLVINDPQSYINSAIANGNVKQGNPTTANAYTDGDVVEIEPGKYVIVRY